MKDVCFFVDTEEDRKGDYQRGPIKHGGPKRIKKKSFEKEKVQKKESDRYPQIKLRSRKVLGKILEWKTNTR